jgi:AcrR family transcriptional regulator
MPKIVDHDIYRKELLEKCFDLFAEKGYGSITMRQIAQGLSVSTGTLYHYFPSKEALFEQLMEEVCEQDVLSAAAEMERVWTLQEKLETLGNYLYKREDYCIKLTYLLVDFCQHQDSKEMPSYQVFERINERYVQAIHDLLGIENLAIASFIYSFIDGVILERLFHDNMISIPEQFTLLGKMLTAYLEQQPAYKKNHNS